MWKLAWMVALGILLAACGGGSPAVNRAPSADAGSARTVAAGTAVTLDGSASSDPEGDPIRYAWALGTRPAGSTAALVDATTARPHFTPDLPGTYAATLLVSDGQLSSAPASVAITATAVKVPPVVVAPAGYSLVWADEFEVDGLPDPARWDYDTERNKTGWFNNELQYYARERPENARVSGGRLIITARKEDLSSRADWGGQRYSSARLVTRGKASWTYGFVEIRAKLPCGVGTWPALWMLGTRGTWPDDGEIDILEQVGSNPTRIFGTLHTLQSGSVGTGGETRIADACSDFHDYQLTWSKDEILIGVDGINYYRSARIAGGYGAWPFDFPQYLLLNIAIGGDLGGAVNDSIFPVMLEIEHVRVFQRP